MKGTLVSLEFPRIPNTTVVEDDRVVIAESGIVAPLVVSGADTQAPDTTPSPEVTA